MTKIKKIAALSLTVVMTVAALVGCGKKKEDTPKIKLDPDNLVSAEVDDKYGACYQVFIYSFCDSDGDGIGDFNGLTSKLDYIKDMGYDSIWLLPFNQSTTYHKYDVVDYYSIDKEYGTMEDFEACMKACDEKNIDVYMDFVINHSSSKCEWFTEAVSYVKTIGDGAIDYKECPYAEWYNFVKAEELEKSGTGGYNKVPGNANYYYECQFWNQMPDLNLNCADLRTEIEKIAKFWIDKGIDGFRLDAALHYFEGDPEGSTEALKWFCDYVYSVDPEQYIVAEVWSDESNINTFYKSGIDSMFDFPYADGKGTYVITTNRSANGSVGLDLSNEIVRTYTKQHEINPNIIDGVFIANHDTGRQAGFLHNKANTIKLGAMLTMFAPGKGYTYYGDELGMSGSNVQKDEDCRTAMYWSDDSSAEGMCKGPNGAAVPEHKHGSYETQKDDANSIYNFYKQTLLVRNAFPEICRGIPSVMDDVCAQDGNLYATKRVYGDETVYVIININDQEASTVNVSKATYGYTGIAAKLSPVEGTDATLNGETLTIPAFGCVILK